MIATPLSTAKLDPLRERPGGSELLDALAGESGVYLVGGAVRDLLLGEPPVDWDLVVEGDAQALAARLAQRLGASFKLHGRFGTATVYRDGDAVDVASARTETYPAPGALPEVSPCELEADLARRDFTINAMAISLGGGDPTLFEFPGAGADLRARLLRVMHDDSFIDDPTRLLRLLRYGARLGFSAEPHTEELARRAVAAHAIRTVLGSRVRDELLDLLGERGAVVALDAMHALGLDRSLHDALFADEHLAGRAALELVDGVRQDLLLLAACCREFDREALVEWLNRLGLTRAERDSVVDSALASARLAGELELTGTPSGVTALLDRRPPEPVAMIAALPEAGEAAREHARAWLRRRHDETLLISGRDLIAAGVAEGPAIGRALATVAAMTLDGDLNGRSDQLATAIELARAD